MVKVVIILLIPGSWDTSVPFRELESVGGKLRSQSQTEVWAFTAWGFISVAGRQKPQKLGRVGDRKQSPVMTSKNPLFHKYSHMIQPLLLTAGEFRYLDIFGECNWLHKVSWCSKVPQKCFFFGAFLDTS